MKKIVVLGSGLVGNVIVQDLATSYFVTIVDKNPSALEKLKHKKNIEPLTADVTHLPTLKSLIKDADLVVTALPGFMAFTVIRQIIENGKNISDISFYPEDAMSLNSLAIQNNCTVIVDCGVAPGMSNFIAGYHASKMIVDEFICYVGGLPVERKFPFEYKAPFSPTDVIEEYTRPARIKENGKIVIKPALSEIEMLDFDGIGTLEAFNTDGLRSLLYTLNIPNMKEKTLRYPGHARLIEALKTIGFFDTSPVNLHNNSVIPIELTTHLLKKIWQLNPNDKEFTIMRIILKGKENHQHVTYTYDLFDIYDTTTGFSSMARTTGFTCAAMAHLILENKFSKHGVYPPELVASDDDIYNYVMNYLKERNVIYNVKRTVE